MNDIMTIKDSEGWILVFERKPYFIGWVFYGRFYNSWLD